MGAFEVDSSMFPLVITRLTDACSARDIDRVVIDFEALLNRRQPYVLVTYPLAGVPLPDAVCRKNLTEWWRLRAEEIREYNLGSATVLDRALHRGAMTAFYWLIEPPSPQYAARDLGDAIDWCFKLLHDECLDITPAMLSYRHQLEAHAQSHVG